jgi:hypothetical protein
MSNLATTLDHEEVLCLADALYQYFQVEENNYERAIQEYTNSILSQQAEGDDLSQPQGLQKQEGEEGLN